jgi:hypothetical protein
MYKDARVVGCNDNIIQGSQAGRQAGGRERNYLSALNIAGPAIST